MTALSVQPPFPILTDIDGQPLEDGYVWIGVANLAPIINPITVYWDAALTIPASQPIRTRGGYPVNSGAPARLYVGSDYSIQVQDKNGSVAYTSLTSNESLSGVITLVLTNIVALRAATWPFGRPPLVTLISNWTTGDGGGTFRWDSVSTATDNGGTIIKETAVITGRWIRQFTDTVDVSWFGADPTGVADATAQIQAASAVVQAMGGGTVKGKADAVYRVYPDATNTSSLGSFTNCNGIKLDFAGVRFAIARAFTGTQILFAFVFENCSDINLNSLYFDCAQIDTPALAFTRGLIGVTFLGLNSNIQFGTLRQTGGKAALDIVRSTSLGHTLNDRTYYVRGIALQCQGVGYPYSGRNNGDDVIIDRLYADSPSRPAIIYGCRGVKFISAERVGTGYAPLLVLANSTGSDLFDLDTETRDVHMSYRSNVDIAAQIELSVRGTGACQHFNHKFDMQIAQVQAGSLTQQAFIISADSSAGVPDTTGGRGHTVNGLALSGRITGCPPATPVFDLAPTVRGNWAGSTIRRVSLRDLTIDGAATADIRVNWDAFPDGIVMDGFEYFGTWTATGTNWGPWARPSFRATKSAAQTALTSTTYVDVTFDTEAYNYGSDFASNVWTPPRGRVQLFAAIRVTGLAAGTAANLAIIKNGSFFRAQEIFSTAAGEAQIGVAVEDAANGTDVYKIQFNGTENSAGSITVQNNAPRTFFSGTHLGR